MRERAYLACEDAGGPIAFDRFTSFHSVVGNERHGDAHERRYGLAHPTADPNSHRARRCAHRDAGAGYWIDHRPAALARPRRLRFRSDCGVACRGRLPGAAAAAARHRPKRWSADRDRPARLCGRRRRRHRAREQGARLSWSGTRSAIASHACSPPIVRNWCVPLRSLPPTSARRRARPRCAQRSARSADTALPDEERLAALQLAFFAPGNDPRGLARGLASRGIGGRSGSPAISPPVTRRLRRRSRRRSSMCSLRPRPARSCRGRAGLQGAIRRPRHSRGDRAAPAMP